MAAKDGRIDPIAQGVSFQRAETYSSDYRVSALWESLQDVEATFDINHVPSHEALEAHQDLADKWILRGNHFADRVSAEANLARPDGFWTLYNKACLETETEQDAQKTLIRFHRWMAQTTTRSSQPAPTREPIVLEVRGDTPLIPLGEQRPSDRKGSRSLRSVVHEPSGTVVVQNLEWL